MCRFGFSCKIEFLIIFESWLRCRYPKHFSPIFEFSWWAFWLFCGTTPTRRIERAADKILRRNRAKTIATRQSVNRSLAHRQSHTINMVILKYNMKSFLTMNGGKKNKNSFCQSRLGASPFFILHRGVHKIENRRYPKKRSSKRYAEEGSARHQPRDNRLPRATCSTVHFTRKRNFFNFLFYLENRMH